MDSKKMKHAVFSISSNGGSLLLLLLVWMHVLLTPFTKVEESFNVQAVHDILEYRSDLGAYDHQAFPGVVPRTFLGALWVAAMSAAPYYALRAQDMPKAAGLVCARLILGTIIVLSLARLCASVDSALGTSVGQAFMLLTSLQFHLPFYASRPLPNTFALAFASLAHADWISSKRPQRAIVLMAAAVVVFRCDLLPWAGLMGVHMLLERQISVGRGLGIGALAAVSSLAVTVLVDSVFWGRWLWPEGEVLWFNTAENRSSEWGTMPLHWYFTSALPRALLGALPLAAIGMVLERRLRSKLACVLIYIAAYSLLPHKEVRFLIPVLPLFNVAAAAGLVRLYRNRLKGLLWRGLWLIALAALACSAAAVVLMTAVSGCNYPGGRALAKMHAAETSSAAEALRSGRNLTVHIDVAAAMTGVSRFGEHGVPWVYSKVEGWFDADILNMGFDYMISPKATLPGYQHIIRQQGYMGMRHSLSLREAWLKVLHGQLPLPVTILQEPQLYVHRQVVKQHD